MLALKTEACLDPLRVRLRLAGVAGATRSWSISPPIQEREFLK
jgi:hypothetical protein